MTGFDALDVAHIAVRELFVALDLVPPRFRSLVEQGRRSGPSVPLNLAEGRARNGKDRIHHFRIAYGSAQETTALLTLLRNINALDPKQVATALELFDRVQAMAWRLTNGR